jgi:signal transduction histidine kinase
MTALARRITAGDRGTRLDPDRPGSELGRAAAAFDGMLDALEDAETRARTSASETRSFLSDAAHELRTPLAGIQALAESIAHAPGADERQQRRARLLVSETGRAGRLVADMLDLARIEEGVALQVAETDLAALVAAEVERVRVLAPGTSLAVSGPATLPMRADAMRVGQILTNLLDNARRHTPPDGRITVTITGAAEVVIANTGPTIADADRERIFGRLVRLQESRDRDSGGAGLGLPVARGLARAHGGDLVCERAQDGARFRLTLPAG